jgi:hypothetical protein
MRSRIVQVVVLKPPNKRQGTAEDSLVLKGWQHIAEFLGQPISVAQRWARTGMPVRREGRFVAASPEQLNKWLGREAGEPVHVATEEADLAAELKRGLAYVRAGKHQPRGDKRIRK